MDSLKSDAANYDIRDDFGISDAIALSELLTDEQKKECEKTAFEMLSRAKQ